MSEPPCSVNCAWCLPDSDVPLLQADAIVSPRRGWLGMMGAGAEAEVSSSSSSSSQATAGSSLAVTVDPLGRLDANPVELLEWVRRGR
jgi:hypothetical protein